MSIARVAVGAGLVLFPRLATPLWVGRRGLTPAATLMARALGARDVGIGGSILAGAPLRPLLAAGIVADGTDLLATLAERDHLPRTAVPLVVATAGAGIAMGAYALAGADS
jgi:hypothetical protein